VPDDTMLDKETVSLKDLPLGNYGCDVVGDNYSHLGVEFEKKTICEKDIHQFFLDDPFTFSCPKCVEMIRFWLDHPEARHHDIGILVHDS
jgi:hypothetical protein